MTETPRDAAYMARALELARAGWGHTAPNPLVGAVVVDAAGNEIVGEGAHLEFGGPHAEVHALRAAGARASGGTLYVTLEPCAHFGKTPPCTEAIIAAGLRRVVMAVEDPTPVAAGGRARLVQAGITVDVGCCADSAQELNAAFFHAARSDRPWVTVKVAVSADGAIARAAHTTTRITGDAARAFAHYLRAGNDAVAVGMHTVRVDDPQLTVRLTRAPRILPRRIVFSRSGVLDPRSFLATSSEFGRILHCIIRTTDDAPTPAALPNEDRLFARSVVDALVQLRVQGIQSVLVEGGAELMGAFFAAAVVDRLVVIRAPVIFGKEGLPAFGQITRAPVDLRVINEEILGADRATTYAVLETPCSLD